jgi:hypothetical protein
VKVKEMSLVFRARDLSVIVDLADQINKEIAGASQLDSLSAA